MEITFKPNWQIRQQQVGDCLQTVGALMSWLRREEDTPVEGNLQTCVEASIINALNRLDKILGDDKSWELGPDAHTFGAEHAALQNAMVHNALRDQAQGRDEITHQFAQLSALLSGDKEEQTPKQRRQHKKSK